MDNKILFVFEGEKTEKRIVDNLTRYFVNEKTIVQCVFSTDIYKLYKEIANDDDLDTFVLLKGKPQNADALSEYSRVDFAEIYLFFDYDGHAPEACDDKIKELLSFFNEETESGKLFISYPMVEALKHYSEKIDFKNLKVQAKENIRYKRIVHREADIELRDFSSYSKAIWIQQINIHLNKLNFIIDDEYSLPTKNSSQNEIFLKQLEKYIDIDSTVSVLSSFPVFIFDYYGYDNLLKLLSE